MGFIQQARTTLCTIARLFGRLMLGFLALYLGTLTFLLFDAYAFDSHNMTGSSYYVRNAAWDLFLMPFRLVDSSWGFILVSGQIILLILLLKRNPLPLKYLFSLAVYSICLAYGSSSWQEPESIASLAGSLMVAGSLYWLVRLTLQKWKPPTPVSTSPPGGNRTSNVLVAIALLAACFAYLYVEIYYPNAHMSDPDIRTSSAKARIYAQKVLSHRLGNHHDAFIHLGSVGTEESIPYLINALQWQKINTPEDRTMVCTKGHCLDALRQITGQYPGSNYADWKAWWEANKTKSRRQWAMEALEKAGLPVSDPPDNIFVQAMVSRTDNLNRGALNAYYILDEIPRERCLAAIEIASHSTDKSERKGAIWCLWQLQFPDATERISPFQKDSDPEVRKLADMAIKSISFEKKRKPSMP